jgi:hypothetical protein
VIKLELTEREFRCLFHLIDTNEDILRKTIREKNITNEDDYNIIVLNLLKEFRRINLLRNLRAIRGGNNNE